MQSPCQLTTWQKASPPAHAKTNTPTTPPHTHRGRNTIIFFYAIPHKQNNHLRAIHPNDIYRPTRNLPKRNQPFAHNPPKRNRRGGACVPARTSAQRRFHTKNRFVHHVLCTGNLTMEAPLWGDTGGHTGSAPTHLHHIFPRNPTQTK